MIMINILTRTSNRPNFFKINYESVKNQILPENVQINHIVSYDTDETEEYLKEYDDIIKVKITRLEKTIQNTFPYNLYFNEMLKYVKTGYIIYLDDDDTLYSNDSISKIINYLVEDSILLWRVINKNETLYPTDYHFNKKQISPNDFPINCFSYHTKWIDKIEWKGMKGGDYNYGIRLYKIINKIKTLNEIICRIGNVGMGYQKDIKK